MSTSKKVVIAADSFKGSATTIEVESYIEQGIRRVDQDIQIVKIPVADGGEGTVDALVIGCQGEYRYVEVTGPLGGKVEAKFGLINDNRVAILEMAEASGLTLVNEEDRDVFKSTTYGTGELIRAALDLGVDEIYIGIGGSATNDGGVGMAQALGVSFTDSKGQEIGQGAAGLKDISSIDVSNIDWRIHDVKITVLSDVSNPLCGDNGASYIYGPQKGASDDDVIRLDGLLNHYGEKIEEILGINILEKEGSGAAGGLGAGLMVFCEAQLYSGIEKVLEILKFEDELKNADLVITGEGSLDSQSLNGKAPIGIAKLAKKYQLPVIAIVGSSDDYLTPIYEMGIDLVIDIINRPMSLSQAIKDVEILITNTGETAYRAFVLHEQTASILQK